MGSNLVLLFEAHHRLDPRLVRSLSSDDSFEGAVRAPIA
jgi:hypothetical protein